jgi:branched-subunit amino acid transport protein
VSDLAAIFVVGIGTYISRALFIVSLSGRKIPGGVLVALQFVAPAVLAALIVALLTDSSGNVDIGPPEISGLAVGAVVAFKTRSHVWTLVAGMAAFWLVGLLV